MSDKHRRIAEEADVIRAAVASLDAVRATLEPMVSWREGGSDVAAAMHHLKLARLLLREAGHGSHFDSPEGGTHGHEVGA